MTSASILQHMEPAHTQSTPLPVNWQNPYRIWSFAHKLIIYKDNVFGTLWCSKWTPGTSVLVEVPVGPDVISTSANVEMSIVHFEHHVGYYNVLQA